MHTFGERLAATAVLIGRLPADVQNRISVGATHYDDYVTVQCVGITSTWTVTDLVDLTLAQCDTSEPAGWSSRGDAQTPWQYGALGYVDGVRMRIIGLADDAEKAQVAA